MARPMQVLFTVSPKYHFYHSESMQRRPQYDVVGRIDWLGVEGT